MTHKFSITAGDFSCEGEIDSNLGGMFYYKFDKGTSYPTTSLNQSLADIIENVGKFLQANGSLKEFTITAL